MNWESIGTFVQWFEASGWGGATGLVLTLLGFGLTFRQLLLTKTAAQHASTAARTALDGVLRFENGIDMAKVLSLMEDLRRLQRDEAWNSLMERYSTLRRILLEIRVRHPDLEDGEVEVIKRSAASFGVAELEIEKSMSQGKAVNLAKVNGDLQVNMDDLTDMLLRLQHNNRRVQAHV